MSNTYLGRALFDAGCRQGAIYRGRDLPTRLRADARESRSDIKRRGDKSDYQILDDDLVVILSQDCDIAAKSDSDATLLEAAVFRRPKLRAIFSTPDM